MNAIAISNIFKAIPLLNNTMRNANLINVFSLESLECRALLSVPAAMTLNGSASHAVPVVMRAHPSAKRPVPASPTDLVQASSTPSTVTLNWTDNSTDEKGFRIDRWNGRRWVTIKTVGANITSFTNKGLKANTPYAYLLYAYNSGGLSISPAFIGDAITLPVGGIAAPTNLTATVVSTSNIILQFTDNATNELGYNVQYSTGGAGGPWVFAGGVPGTPTTGARLFNFTAAQTGQTYTFRVAPYTATQFFDYLPPATATAPASGARPAVQSDGKFYTATTNTTGFGSLNLNRFNSDGTADTTFGTNGTIPNYVQAGVYPSTLTFPAGLPNGQVLAVFKGVSSSSDFDHILGIAIGMSPTFATAGNIPTFTFDFRDTAAHNFTAFPPNPILFVNPDGTVLIATNQYGVSTNPSGGGGPQLTKVNADLTAKFSIQLPAFPDSIAGLPNGVSAVTTGSIITLYDASGNLIQ